MKKKKIKINTSGGIFRINSTYPRLIILKVRLLQVLQYPTIKPIMAAKTVAQNARRTVVISPYKSKFAE